MSSSDDSAVVVATDITVVIPSLNSAPWLLSTLDALDAAARMAGVRIPAIVVDDGSTDNTAAVLRDRGTSLSVTVSVITQPNRGRFAARFAGATAATTPYILLLDSRVLLHIGSIRRLRENLQSTAPALAWNGHIEIDPDAPLVGRLWEVLTHIFWREYLAHPRPMDITSENFDRMPKGTTVFAVDRELFLDTCRSAWPQAHTALVSDDTMLLRALTAATPIRIDPGFSATYRPRTSFGPFMRHTFDRGTMFVDSYAGTTTARSVALIGLAILPIIVLMSIAFTAINGLWGGIAGVVSAVALVLIIPLVVAARCGAPHRALLAWTLYVVPFGAAFWAGLVRGLVIHRDAFARTAHHAEQQQNNR